MSFTVTQLKFLVEAESGLSERDIAEKYRVEPSAVSRSLKRARNVRCPFAPDCADCILPKCGIDPDYAYLFQHGKNGQKGERESILLRKKAISDAPNSAVLREHNIRWVAATCDTAGWVKQTPDGPVLVRDNGKYNKKQSWSARDAEQEET